MYFHRTDTWEICGSFCRFLHPLIRRSSITLPEKLVNTKIEFSLRDLAKLGQNQGKIVAMTLWDFGYTIGGYLKFGIEILAATPYPHIKEKRQF